VTALIFILGAIAGLVIGICIGASGGSNNYTSSRPSNQDLDRQRTQDYLNNPVVRELQEQARNKDYL